MISELLPESRCLYMLKRLNFHYLILVLIIILSYGADARAACWAYVQGGGVPSVLSNEPIQAAISAPPDLPIGSILYHGLVNKRQPQIGVGCDQNGPFYVTRTLTTTQGESGYTAGVPPFSNIAGNMPVYKTNLPGVGVAFNSSSGLVAQTNCTNTKYCYWIGDVITSYVYLVKIGEITPGVVYGGKLPVYRLMMGQSGQLISTLTRQFSGQVTITVPTCTTPDVTVDLGSWKINQFTGKKATTDWKDASLVLRNCPRFYGFRAGHTIGYGTTISYSSPSVRNRWGLVLSPQNGTIDNANGIMAIDQTIPNAASGVGIQLGYGSVTSAASNLVNFTIEKTGNIPATGDSSITIPLAARYIQTEDRVTPGRADGKVTFTISYK